MLPGSTGAGGQKSSIRMEGQGRSAPQGRAPWAELSALSRQQQKSKTGARTLLEWGGATLTEKSAGGAQWTEEKEEPGLTDRELSLCFLGSVRLPGCKPWWTRPGNEHRSPANSLPQQTSCSRHEGSPLCQARHSCSFRLDYSGHSSGAGDESLPRTLGSAVQPWPGLFGASDPSPSAMVVPLGPIMDEGASLH